MKRFFTTILLLVIIAVIAVSYFKKNIETSPKYALWKISQDIETSGVEGLMPHLTGTAENVVSALKTITDNDTVSSVLSFLGVDHTLKKLETNLQATQWTLVNVLEAENTASVLVEFRYPGGEVGVLEIEMTKDADAWKISSISLPDA